MCGIIGAVSQREIVPILLEGLKRLEYRGYDSAGMAVIGPHYEAIERLRALGKVEELEKQLANQQILANIGIAHTRWATHGKPSQSNAHPHISKQVIALVHNGIIENYAELRNDLIAAGYEFSSDTDSEVITHLIHHHWIQERDFLKAVRSAVAKLSGAYALAIMHLDHPDHLIAVRSGSPLVLGLGLGENFIASDALALMPLTQRFIFLEEGDIAIIQKKHYQIFNQQGMPTEREIQKADWKHKSVDRGEYRHFMLKEIYEQPVVISETLGSRLTTEGVNPAIFGQQAVTCFPKVERLQIVACGTSYHAALVCKYWMEKFLNIPCCIDIASEYRYRDIVVEPNTLYVSISQSGETADTLSALRKAKQSPHIGYAAICNVSESSLVRESDMTLLTYAGPEIGVASTKAFTTQLTALLLLVLALGEFRDMQNKAELLSALQQLPRLVKDTLNLKPKIEDIATEFLNKASSIFLGRGIFYPIAMEGALKLKEISYIHAEAYPAGELKHGPLALIDNQMPVVAIAPNDELLQKLLGNLSEVQARGGKLFVFGETEMSLPSNSHLIKVPQVPNVIAPIVYTIPLQLLAYYVAVLKGTDIDRPRNLAKSVTVE